MSRSGISCSLNSIETGDPPDNLSPLPSKNIDTGMGLERVAATLQGVETNFHIDILRPIVDAASEITGIHYVPDSDTGRFLRRITDHVRACTFAIHENVYPGSSKAEYVVRRLLRRCTLEGRQLGREEPFLYKLVPAIVQSMSKPYPELGESLDRIQQVIKSEEGSFLNKLDDGLIRIEKIFESMRSQGNDVVNGAEAADLYQTFGIPPELIESQAQERNFGFDWDGFKKAMEEFGVISGKIADTVMGDSGPVDEIRKETKSTEFLGYDTCETECKVVGLVDGENRSESISTDSRDTKVVLDRTPFYAESGGQVADIGMLRGPSGTFAVEDVKKNGDVFVHTGRVVNGTLDQNETVKAIVDSDRRDAIRRAHTATHILHYSLQQTLGSHAQQRGSKVDGDWLRFDFANLEPVSTEQLDVIEKMTVDRIASDSEVKAEILPLAQAKEQGAMMLFGEKYPDPVRMVSIGDFSKELCGGTHLNNSNEIGAFEVSVEESVSAGTRRIEAVTGRKAEQARRSVESTVDSLAKLFSVGQSNIEKAFVNLVADVKELKKQIKSGNRHEIEIRSVQGGDDLEYHAQRTTVRSIARSLNVAVGDVIQRVDALFSEKARLIAEHETMGETEKVDADLLIESAEEIGGVKTIIQELASSNPNMMRQLIDQIRKKVSPVAMFLVSAQGTDKVMLVAGVSNDLVDQGVKAGDWVKAIAPIVGGGGGGRPDMAQAGGKQPEKIGEAIQSAKESWPGKYPPVSLLRLIAIGTGAFGSRWRF